MIRRGESLSRPLQEIESGDPAGAGIVGRASRAGLPGHPLGPRPRSGGDQ